MENEELQVEDTQVEETGTETYQLPEEYQSANWANNAPEFKSQDEALSWALKSYDAQHKYVGGKLDEYAQEQGLVNIPKEPEKINEFIKQFAPETAEGYNLKEKLPENEVETFSTLFKEIGVTKEQAQKLVDGVTTHNQKIRNELINPEGFNKNLKELFGENLKGKQEAENVLIDVFGKEKVDVFNKSMPNNVKSMFYELGKKVNDNYGYSESARGSQGNQVSYRTELEVQTELEATRNKLVSLDNVEHTQEQKDALHSKYTELGKELSKLRKGAK